MIVVDLGVMDTLKRASRNDSGGDASVFCVTCLSRIEIA